MSFPTQSASMRVVIKEVNMAQRFISGTDAFGKTYRVLLDFHGAVVISPTVGEMWQIERRGNDWILGKRLETGNEQTKIEDLQPGDHRLEAKNRLILNGNLILINGTDFQDILNRLDALEETVGP